jgi:hypothetical protein
MQRREGASKCVIEPAGAMDMQEWVKSSFGAINLAEKRHTQKEVVEAQKAK